MKKQLIITVILALVITDNSYGKKNEKEQFFSAGLAITTLKYKPGNIFQDQLAELIIASLQINEGLRNDDSQVIQSGVMLVMEILLHMNESSLTSKGRFAWYLQEMKMALRLKRIYNSTNLENQKEFFDEFNRELYKCIKAYGLSKKRFYYQSCFIALDQKGGHWFNDNPSINNPYLTPADEKCGFVTEILK